MPLLCILSGLDLQSGLSFQGLCQHLLPLSSPWQSECEIHPLYHFSFLHINTHLTSTNHFMDLSNNTEDLHLLQWVLSGRIQPFSISLAQPAGSPPLPLLFTFILFHPLKQKANLPSLLRQNILTLEFHYIFQEVYHIISSKQIQRTFQ